MSAQEPGSDLGYLGQYGVLVVPAPLHADGAWFVTLTRWDTGNETYTATAEGPMFETRRDALDEAERLIDWIAEHQDEDDVARTWDLMRQELAREEMPSQGLASGLRSLFPGI